MEYFEIFESFELWNFWRKFWKFWFHSIINMKNNYHQTFVVFYLITYSHVKFTLFICYLFRLHKNMLKRVRDKTKMIFSRQKYQKKYVNALKIEWNKQICQVTLNACVYAKQKINLTWPYWESIVFCKLLGKYK